MVQDYVTQTVGATKRVMLTYGPQGRSRGIATIIFANPTFGPKAAKMLDGVQVDSRTMRVCEARLLRVYDLWTTTNNQYKVEVVVGANQAPATAGPKSLADRMT